MNGTHKHLQSQNKHKTNRMHSNTQLRIVTKHTKQTDYTENKHVHKHANT